MHRSINHRTLAAAIAVALGGATAAHAATDCEELANLALPDTEITVAERVTSGSFTPPGSDRALEVPAMCRVAGVVAPAIRFEVWLPEGDAWNGRFQAVGGGGLAGIISYPAMAGAARDGYATASTDTGHEATDTEWLGDRQRIIDYGYRAIHEMTVKAKTVIGEHYGAEPEYSYFNGCSTGGRQGLMEAQRFPDDYDGIVSGAPVNRFTHLHIGQLWTAHATLTTPGAVLSRGDFALVMDTVLAQCDAADGVEDGMLTDPRSCDFDPAVLQCAGSRTDSCLSAPQIEALEKVYRGAVNPRTGEQIYSGLEPGGEGPQPGNPGWALLMNGEGPFPIDQAVIGGMAFENDAWDWRTFDFDRDVEHVDAKLYGVLNAVSPDLRDFEAQGGKLIVYHGWNDPGVMPQQTIDYYEQIVDFAGKATGGDGAAFTDEYLRLFMMPGVGHCRGGAGPDQADFMDAIAAWVEDGRAPERIVARQERDGEVTMTRPLCPHPEIAHYTGSGDTKEAESFECRLPE
ncbi:MAG: tannase/feruloyl esterase family alpha/beta hydrolase [Gammaproteobacteria bacterium]|nr:tannase/feruloyl esterase family alpha/beta hydrolase [Gammaproteobacteria bacterium]